MSTANASVEIAKSSDDASIRALLRETAMPGAISATFTREPSFFDALQVEGRSCQTVIARDPLSGHVVGVGCCSAKSTYVNGSPTAIGYLSSLRIADAWRNGRILSRAYQLLHENLPDPQARLFLTTIIEDNHQARVLLTSGRAGLPAYHDLGRFQSMAIDLRAKQNIQAPTGCLIRSASEEDVPAIIAFWRHEGAKRQFFPVYEAEDLRADKGLLRGLKVRDVLLSLRGGEICGTAAAWKQTAFRQSVVTGYGRAMQMIRPLYNLSARLLHYPALPKAGDMLDYFSLSLVCIKDDERAVFAALVAELMRRHQTKAAFMMAGLHERDPLLPVLRRHPHFTYRSRLYVVNWQEGADAFRQLDDRTPYLELGAL